MRNTLEFLIILLIAAATLNLQDTAYLSTGWMNALIVVLCGLKSLFFIAEEMVLVGQATQTNLAYHKFMSMMLINMIQIILSFSLDDYCLLSVDAGSFSINPQLVGAERAFECLYFSTLNFTFFDYGDINPQTVPAMLVTMTEISLAFLTVIFLLSDFISLKESLTGARDRPPRAACVVRDAVSV